MDVDQTLYRVYSSFTLAGCYMSASVETGTAGDIYDIFDLPDSRVGLVMADVAGKGEQNTAYSTAARYMLRAYALINPEPEYVLEHLNKALCVYTPSDIFVTLVYAVIDPVSCTFIYGNAGHSEPLLYRAGLGWALPLDITGRALGIIPKSEYSQRLLKLLPGDILLVYTDGITNARNDSGFLGIQSLTDAVLSVANCSEKQIAEKVLELAVSFSNYQLKDDAAVIAVKAGNNDAG